MLRFWLILLVMLAAGAIAGASFAPASLADRWIASATQDRLRLADADGTLWRGRGMLSDARGAWRLPIGWKVDPSALVRGALALELEPRSDGGSAQGRVQWVSQTLDLSGVRLDLPVTGLVRLASEALPAELGGRLTVEAPSFRYEGRGGTGALDLRWERARLVWNGVALDLGTVSARLSPSGDALRGTLANNGGDAKIDGDLAAEGGVYAVRATITPGPTLPPDLARLVATLGTRDNNGAVHVQWRFAAR